MCFRVWMLVVAIWLLLSGLVVGGWLLVRLRVSFGCNVLI